MVYLTSWDEFVERSVQLFRDNPESTRYVIKYRHCDGKLVLKVTDNREVLILVFTYLSLVVLFLKLIVIVFLQCLKYKTDQAQEAKKMEKLNNIFFTLMARGPEVDLSEVTMKEQMDAQPSRRGRGRKQ
ncbi:signal recognition particle 9 kDa protein [Senna tora]|uniref:Signal recognition particle 9 kDa protein n=1 Tax=Senna tora TaxID=362788 RepID=A0A834W0B2_9FABA|nr:signal recognition particle 9 kDa protein [Senna tora]